MRLCSEWHGSEFSNQLASLETLFAPKDEGLKYAQKTVLLLAESHFPLSSVQTAAS